MSGEGQMVTILKPFEYVTPATVDEAVSILDRDGDRAKVVAGGTDLICQMAKKKVNPEILVDIGRIKDLDFITQSDDTLRIGARTTFHRMEMSELLRRNTPILVSAAEAMGKPQIRNRGTIGGNLANGSPAADGAVPLLALDADVVIAGPSGERTLPLTEFYRKETALKAGELLTEVRIPLQEADRVKGHFIKLGIRLAACLSVVNVSVLIGRDNGTCSSARIALGAVAPVPMRAYRAEAFLMGKELTDQVVREAARIAADETQPISDVRASKEYRKEAAEVLIRRAIEEAR